MNGPRQVAARILSTVVSDGPWQDLGFPRRPRHGEIIQRFRPQWRVHLEKTVLKEMLIVLTAAHVHAGVIDASNVDEVVSVYVAGPEGTQDLWRSLGYSSRSEAQLHLSSSIPLYAKAVPTEWSGLLSRRLDVAHVSDQRMAAALFVGVVTFTQTAREMANYLVPDG